MTDANFQRKLNEILLTVEKPARYVGGEYNTPDMKKPFEANLLLCFPDVYEIGMSNLGVAILYDIVNKTDGYVAERCYAPAPDFAQKLKENNIPLLSLETKKPLKDFTVVGFSVGFELLYTNVLYMLDLAQIPFRAKDRDDSYPILLAGGPCSVNPEPFADFFDIILVGEGEDADIAILKVVTEGREQGLSKQEILKKVKGMEGAYVPSLHQEGETVVKAVVQDFENAEYPTHPLVSNIEAIHDRATLELYRGCASGCRFCQAGFWYRPIRERSAKRCAEIAKEMVGSTGFDEISLCSLSTSDYTGLEELEAELGEYCKQKRINLALPSLRISSFKPDMANNSRRSSLTFAPEAGTQRLRNVINKNVTEEEIDKISVAFEAGYDSVKLYFMMGLPTETDEDVRAIIELAQKVVDLFYHLPNRPKGKGVTVTISVACFVPKPFTPFQFEPQDTPEQFTAKQQLLLDTVSSRKISISYHDSGTSRIEAVLARGDRRLAPVVEEVWKNGGRLEGWEDHFTPDRWYDAMEKQGLSPDFYATRRREYDEIMPWDHLEYFISKEFLVRENRLTHESKTTPNCRQRCAGCGVSAELKGVSCSGNCPCILR